MIAADLAERFRRQLDLLPLDRLAIPITLIGAGAVGSFATVTLAKMGFNNLLVYDDDVVDVANLPNQMYRTTDVGLQKVEALADLVKAFEGIEIQRHARRYEGEALAGIVVSCVDSMASRAAIWKAVRYDPAVQLLLCCRMGGLVSIVRPVRPLDPADVRRYESTLHLDSEAIQEPCSARSILFTVVAIASTVARLVRMEVVGEDVLPHEVVQDHRLGLLLTS